MPPDTVPLLYAELLSNIRQVSVAAALPSSSDADTAANISSDGQLFILTHDGRSETLRLPAQVSLRGRLPIPKLGGRDLSWRLPLHPSAYPPRPPSSDDSQPPWSAADLMPGSAVTCRRCGQEIVRDGVVQTWKDLPSENWAEMMELWHCHKPTNLNASSHEHLATRGYGANSAIGAQDGVGLVDLMLLLFSENNCVSLKVCSSHVASIEVRVSRRWPGLP